MKINPRGYWENDTEEGHGVDTGLAKALRTFFDCEWKEKLPNYKNGLVIADIGCGTGFYTKEINKSSHLYCCGYDGNPHTKEIAGEEFIVRDFSLPIEWENGDEIPIYDWVLSLEVGEHIPAVHENVFISNLGLMAFDGIVLSWAVEGQGGDGHVNCHNNDYIIGKMKYLSFEYDPESTAWLRDQVAKYPKPCYWFRDTLMVFRKKK